MIDAMATAAFTVLASIFAGALMLICALVAMLYVFSINKRIRRGRVSDLYERENTGLDRHSYDRRPGGAKDL